MKKTLMVVLALVLISGSASATTLFGIFTSGTTHTESDLQATAPAAYMPYTIYCWMYRDPSISGIRGWELSIVDSGVGDMTMGEIVYTPAAGSIGSPFSETAGWAVAMNGAACVTDDWSVVATINMLNMDPLCHTLTLVPSTLTGFQKMIDCENTEHNLFLISTMGVNCAGTPSEESSWGAIKSIYNK